jgi:PilZ domain
MPPDGTRRSGRIPKQLAINLFGSDMEGRVFSERTKTVVLSRYGAGIVSSYKLSAEQELIIRSEASHKEIEARVVGQIGSEGDTYIYGIAFLDRTINFWDIDFPDLSDTEKLASETLLECHSCQSREMADHSDLASDVMAVNDSIMRYCRKCGSSTLWKQAAPGSTPSADLEEPLRLGVPPLAESFPAAARPALEREEREVSHRQVSERQVSERQMSEQPASERTSSFAGAALMETEISTGEAKLEPAASGVYSSDRDDSILTGGDHGEATKAEAAKAEAPSAATSSASVAVKEKDRENRRKHVRTRVNFKACVRRPGLADDVVACEDMSRGGLRFKSNRKYFEKMLIDVAVPYAPGDQAIFVPAQIAYVQELPEQNTYRCGVMYLRSSTR